MELAYSKDYSNLEKNICFKAIQNSEKSNRVPQAWKNVCHQIFDDWEVQIMRILQKKGWYLRRDIFLKKVYKWAKHGFSYGKPMFTKKKGYKWAFFFSPFVKKSLQKKVYKWAKHGFSIGKPMFSPFVNFLKNMSLRRYHPFTIKIHDQESKK